MVSHQTRNELGFLVVEEHLCDTAQVLSHDADAVVHVSAGQDGVGTLNIHGTVGVPSLILYLSGSSSQAVKARDAAMAESKSRLLNILFIIYNVYVY